MHFLNAFWHGNEKFPKGSSWNEITPLFVVFHLPYSKYKGVKMFCSYRYQNQNFSLVSHSCRSCSTCVAVVSFVQHSCCTCLALVLLVFGTRVVNQTRSNVAYNNEKKITTEEKQLIDLHRRHQEEYLHF